jgi:valyl-tRNA synthetase
VLLGLFAPFAPFVTEHLYQRFYAAHEPGPSLHLTRWPAADPAWRADPASRRAVDQLTVILDATRALRSELRLGNSARLRSQAHTTPAADLLDLIAEPLRLAARADAVARGEAGHPSGVDGVTVAVTPR